MWVGGRRAHCAALCTMVESDRLKADKLQPEFGAKSPRQMPQEQRSDNQREGEGTRVARLLSGSSRHYGRGFGILNRTCMYLGWKFPIANAK